MRKGRQHFLKVFLDPVVSDSCATDDGEEGLRKGAIGFRRPSGNKVGRWDYTQPCDYPDDFKGKPKGKGKKLNLVK